MIELSGISKSYGKIQVLKSIDLNIKKNELVSIVGPSGAGKSTLLQIIGTLDTPDKGSIVIDHMDLSKLSSKQLANFRNKQIGFVFQFHQLLPEFTALENVCIPAFIGGVNKKQAEKKGLELLSYLGLENRANHKPAAMSGGEQQRVAVARALINNPLVVLADEPSGNLDSVAATQLHDLFFKLREELGLTFVIVTHNEVLAKQSDRIITIKDGSIVNA